MYRHFKAFVAVAEHLHFTRAAEELHMTQPSLSLLIKQLEAQLNVRLITRSTRHVRLTDMGRILLPLAEKAVGEMDAAVRHMRDLSDLKAGRVSVAAFPSVAANQLPPLLVEFRRLYPRVKLQVIDSVWGTVVEKVREGVADFGIGSQPPKMDNLNFEKIYDDEIMLLAPRAHPFAARGSLTWQDISGEEIIALATDTGVRYSVDMALAGTGISFRPVMEPSLIQTVAALVTTGAGIGMILSSYLKAVNMDGLVAIPLYAPHVLRPVGIITRRDWPLSPAALVLLKMIVEELKGKGGRPKSHALDGLG